MVCCMVIRSIVNDGNFIKVDEFFYLYRLMESKLKGYWEFRPWDRKLKMVLDSPSSHRDWKQRFFFISGEGWGFLQNENLDEAPIFLCQWETLVVGASFCAPLFLSFHFVPIINLLYIFFLVKTHPHMSSHYKDPKESLGICWWSKELWWIN